MKRHGVQTGAELHENLSIRQLYLRIAGGRGHFTVIATAAGVADQMQAWFGQEAADGFNILPPSPSPSPPQGLDDFLARVVPEAQRRGLFRTAYGHASLRGHLGLAACRTWDRRLQKYLGRSIFRRFLGQ
ncbi:hypothetical protein [Massilia sp. CCM 8734]|uniref:hypothetical protein n=1 Tax=Massilia sp. CCM 8734 TaxID=2609283 RepID=UPI001AAEB000|nr:hypothetical protein [Massilia sp. CCM 8734]